MRFAVLIVFLVVSASAATTLFSMYTRHFSDNHVV